MLNLLLDASNLQRTKCKKIVLGAFNIYKKVHELFINLNYHYSGQGMAKTQLEQELVICEVS